MSVLNLRIIRISFASLLTGLMVGIVAGTFRTLLMIADRLRGDLVIKAHGWPYAGWLAPLALGVGAIKKRWLPSDFAF